ncbi:MAG: LytTR family transcriptional regulator [Lachnospiraceae bacterium]|nr:LytTR family transcriptional regulator [Lachnospiraceae bacterium]
MKIRIETDERLEEDEIIIRCRELNEETLELQRQLQSLIKSQATLSVSHGELDYFLKYPEIIFMETDGNRLAVHTKDKIFSTKQKLYELEELLPPYFMRVSKSCILNIKEIRSIHKNITGASEIEFAASSKKAYVSRNYYKLLIDKMTH